MKKREILIEIICVLFILLFAYASISKFLEYSDFVVQLHKSPMLVDLANIVAWLIPSLEIVTCILLVFSASRMMGLYASLVLMSIFTFYIIAILGYSEYVPCSCGGILQKLGWKEHLVFNVLFCGLGLLGIHLEPNHQKIKPIILSASLILASLIFIATLFTLTYEETEKYSSFNKTDFVSRLGKKDSVSLGVNSYYFAGTNDKNIFLGNETAPNLIVVINSTTLQARSLQIQLQQSPSQHSKIKVVDNEFFLYDGTVPKIFYGNINDLIATESTLEYGHFNDFVPVSKNLFALRVLQESSQFSLAITSIDSGFRLRPGILRKQIDGRFDVDGTFFFNSSIRKLCYVHLYTNQFIALDTLLKNPLFRRTIDTVRTAKIKVSTVTRQDKTSTIVIPALTVNHHSFAAGNFLFVESGIRAKNETKSEVDRTLRIDAYEFIKGDYVASFSIPIETILKPREFISDGKKLFFLTGDHLISYDMTSILAECDASSGERNFTGR